MNKALAILLSAALPLGPALAQERSARREGYTFRVATDLVLVNVTVRDKAGNFVRGLSRDDFNVVEDNKPQRLVSFDVENVDVVPSSATRQLPILNAPKPAPTKAQPPAPNPQDLNRDALRDRRLIVLFFDLTAMQPEEIDRAVTAARKYVDKQMTPADLVAVVSLGSSLHVDQDFTSDPALLQRVLQRLSPGSGQGFEAGATGDTEGTPDTAQPFTPDETEYNIYNTDRRLEALGSLSTALSHIPQKKSLIYFSSGMQRTGIENQSELRAAINAAVRANLSVYTLDLRGLQALVPGGEAQQASLRGVAPYSGRATFNQLESNFGSQETLFTVAKETGGRAFFDSNDFGRVFSRVQEDTSTYYVLGYQSSNPARDGRFRRISVRVGRTALKLEYRRGYYAPADFQHATQEERERQLEEELASELPNTDLPVYLSAGYFRIGEKKYFVPVSLVVPGREIPFTRASDQDRATLDILGVMQDASQRPVGSIRDTVKLALHDAMDVRRKNVQYDSGFLVAPGSYHLKLVLRENQTGRLGSFETDLVIPDMKAVPLKMSTVVLSSQMQPAKKRKGENPLIHDGSELIPSVTHVFSAGQHLYLYYEVYDPARPSQSAAKQSEKTEAAKSGIRVLTNVAFFSGKVKAYETPLVEARELNVSDRRAAAFQLDVPLGQLRPGFYTCQINVIDDVGGHFLFPRLALLVRK